MASTPWPGRSRAAALIFIASGLPICYYGARYGVDMDLLTRGSGFGYLGSTITSAVYASFTFILFAIEAVILSAVLKLAFGIPLPIGHIISALVVIPIAAFGFRRISQWQNWTQPLWLVLQVAPLIFLAGQGEQGLRLWQGFEGNASGGPAGRKLRHRPGGVPLADAADRRAGRLSALPAGEGDSRRPALVAGAARHRARLDPPRAPRRSPIGSWLAVIAARRGHGRG